MWSTTFQAGTAIAAVTQLQPIDLAGDLVTAGVGVLGGTIMRTHIRLSVSSTAADTNPGLQYGLVVFDRLQVSPTSPVVLTDLDIDWMIQNFLSPATARNGFLTATNYLFGEDIDLRSRRRLHEVNDRPFLILRNNGSAGLTFSLMAKMLIALP
jgi:hypothetical protein